MLLRQHFNGLSAFSLLSAKNGLSFQLFIHKNYHTNNLLILGIRYDMLNINIISIQQ